MKNSDFTVDCLYKPKTNCEYYVCTFSFYLNILQNDVCQYNTTVYVLLFLCQTAVKQYLPLKTDNVMSILEKNCLSFNMIFSYFIISNVSNMILRIR